MRPWIALFSQTGSEIANICKFFSITPVVLITTRKDLEGVNEGLKHYINNENLQIIYLPKYTSAKDYNDIFSKYENPIITLHGFLRIIPADTCKRFEIYNLHPAPLVTYPHLKGKDPQVRTFEEKLKYSGNTIHKCIAELDAGPILAQNIIEVKNNTLDEIFIKTHKAASGENTGGNSNNSVPAKPTKSYTTMHSTTDNMQSTYKLCYNCCYFSLPKRHSYPSYQ